MADQVVVGDVQVNADPAAAAAFNQGMQPRPLFELMGEIGLEEGRQLREAIERARRERLGVAPPPPELLPRDENAPGQLPWQFVEIAQEAAAERRRDQLRMDEGQIWLERMRERRQLRGDIVEPEELPPPDDEVPAYEAAQRRMLREYLEMIDRAAEERRRVAAERRREQEEREEAERVFVVTEEMVAYAKMMREKDESNPSTALFSRACFTCAVENPHVRAVFVKCGHIVCYPCAVDNARHASSKCVFCRKKSGFVKLSENEYGSEEKNDVNDED